MAHIAVVGDPHEGHKFAYRVDPETGISERSLDLHANFARAAEHTIDRGAKLFIVAGDMFDRTHVSPTFREMVRRDVIEPLGKAGIEVWILAGNHDQPRSFARSTSLDDYRGYSHVKVFREPDTEVREWDSARVGFILLPYLHPEMIALRVRESIGEDVPREEAFELGRKMWKEWIASRAAELKTDRTYLIAHYYVEGAKISSITYPEVLPGEFTLTRDVVPDEVDLAIFGHIHLHQTLGPKIVYTGAPERIDWGEREDEKGFILLNAEAGKWEFVTLPAREMVKVEVDVCGLSNPTQAILDALPADPSGKLLRLEVTYEEGQKPLIDQTKISRRLGLSFYYDAKWQEMARERIGAVEFTMDPYILFREYVRSNLSGHPRVEEVLEEGEMILKEVLE